MRIHLNFYSKTVLLVVALGAFQFCTSDLEGSNYIRAERQGDFKARIVVDSTKLYRSSRNSGQLNVDVKYKAVLLDTDIDSLEWIFPNGNP